MSRLNEQIKSLNIPYPEKFYLINEIEDHLKSEKTGDSFSTEELHEFYEIHNSFFYKFIKKMNDQTRCSIDVMVLLVPLTSLLFFLAKEEFMLKFIAEGGVIIYPVIGLSIILMYKELLLFFRTVVLKDHSYKNMLIDSNSVFIGALGLIAIGIMATALGLYFTTHAAVNDKEPLVVFLVGLRESLSGIILASTAAAIILVMHFTTRRILLGWRAPISNP